MAEYVCYTQNEQNKHWCSAYLLFYQSKWTGTYIYSLTNIYLLNVTLSVILPYKLFTVSYYHYLIAHLTDIAYTYHDDNSI